MFNFDLFNRVTGAAILSGPKEVVNDAQLTNYRTLGYMLRGQPMSRTLQGGKSLTDIIYLSENPRMRSYSPGISKQTYSDPQPGVLMTQNWRFFLTDMVVRDEEVDLQAGSEMSSEARFQKIKDLLYMKQQDKATNAMAYWERALWASPDKTKMEGSSSTTTEMMSIPSLINESGICANYTTGAVTTGLLGAAATGGAWTAVQGIDPTAAGNANWRNQVFGYGNTAASGFSTTSLENVISVLDFAFDSLNFEPPPMMKEYFEDPAKDTSPRPFIACSLKGKQKLTQLYRLSNNRWENLTDPWMQPTYAGYSIVYIPQLDTVNAYYSVAGGATGTLTTEALAADTGPRYWLINPKYLYTVWHKDAFMQPIEVGRTVEDPTAKVTPYKTYGNTWLASRKRQGLVIPLDNYN